MIPAPNVSHILCNALLIVRHNFCLGEVNLTRLTLDLKVAMLLFVHVFDEVFCKVGLEWADAAKEYAKKMLLLRMKKE